MVLSTKETKDRNRCYQSLVRVSVMEEGSPYIYRRCHYQNYSTKLLGPPFGESSQMPCTGEPRRAQSGEKVWVEPVENKQHSVFIL